MNKLLDISNIKKISVTFLRWIGLGTLIGICGGVAGTLFSKSVDFVTQLRVENEWLVYILPIGGLVTVAIYKLFKIEEISTNRVFESVRGDKNVPLLLAPAVFICSIITHFLGGSAGREGAALQIGGSIASLIFKFFKPDEDSRHTLVQCGMAAVFSALFGTPLGACVFALEVIRVGQIRLVAVFPCMISSVIAFGFSKYFGVEFDYFQLTNVPQIQVSLFLKLILIAASTAILSNIFCRLLHSSQQFMKKLFPNSFIRIFIGGLVIIALSVMYGTSDYNGSGMDVISRIFTIGEVRSEAFLLKIIITVVTVAAGYKGGEIVPSLFIGATFGAAFGGLIGIPVSLSAAVGMAAMFCGVTNCPLASMLISIELFGAGGAVYYALACAISFLLSGYTGLYEEQKILFSKIDEVFIDKNAE